MPRLTATMCALALIGALASNPAEAVQRVFVASFGNDANTATNCGFANPCRGFTAAMTVVDPGGEVVALDAAGYGAVTITKSVTLTANPGFYAGISASTGNAVEIATAAVKVTLRGLNINGIGAMNGVYMTNGDRLSIENCIISNFSNNGVDVSTAATVRIVDVIVRDNYEGAVFENGAKATISGSKFLGNTDRGVYVSGGAAGVTSTAAISDSIASGNYVGFQPTSGTVGNVATMSVTRSTMSNNQYGVASSASGGVAIVTLSNSMVTGNTVTGLYQSGGSTFETLGNNTVRLNAANISGTITTVAPM